MFHYKFCLCTHIGFLLRISEATHAFLAAYKHTALNAGVNMDMASLTYVRNLPKLVADGKVTEAELNAAVLPILAIKYQMGLFDHPYIDESKVEATLSRPEGLVLERTLAAR